MGVGSSQSKKKITAAELNELLKQSNQRCKICCQTKNRIIEIKQSQIEIKLRQNNINTAKEKMKNILKEENEIAVYELLEPLLETLMEKCDSIISNKRCPSEIKNNLDTVLYASIRVEMEELQSFREKIIDIYGNKFVTKAQHNKEQSVNPDLIEKLQPKIFGEELINQRLKQLCLSKRHYQVFTQITSNVNGLFCKTKVTQKFSNPLDNPLELRVYIYQKLKKLFFLLSIAR